MRDLMGLEERSGLRCPPKPSGRGANAQGAPALPSPAAQMAPATRPGTLFTGPPDPRCADGRGRTAVNAPRLARLVFHVLQDRTAVFAVGSNGKTSWHIVSTGHDQLTNRIGDLRRSLEVDSNGRGISISGASPAPAPDVYRDQLRSLYPDLIEPVESAFQPGETIVIEPHGPLWLLPFAALEDRSGRALIERWAFVYSPSDAILNQIRHEPPYEIPRDVKALVIGNPNPPNLVAADDDRFRSAGLRVTFQPLPGAEEEARAIADLMSAGQATLLIGGQATLSEIESKLSTHTLLHLASHALAFANSPLDSFVVLTADSGNDGHLTARRVLDQRVFADIVTLSACQTGAARCVRHDIAAETSTASGRRRHYNRLGRA
jgi:hypothetical protein